MKKIILLLAVLLGTVVLLCSCDCKHENLSQATCTTSATCLDCGETISGALGHTDGEWIIDKEANCTEDGSKHQVCSVCNDTIKTETLTKLGHTDGEWITDKEANCTEDGSKHQVCSVCNDTIKTETLTKLGHTDGEWIIDKEANCTEDGSKHQVCSVCNDTINTKVIYTLTHFHTFITCDTKTNTFYYDCHDCDTIVTKKVTPINATINSQSMGGTGMTWTVNATGGSGTYKYALSIFDSTLSICYYSSPVESYNVIGWPISPSSANNFYQSIRENNCIAYVTIYDDFGKITYSFKIDGSFVWKLDTTVVSPYTVTYNTNQLAGTFCSTGLSSGANGFNLLLQASSTGGYGNHKYQLIAYNYDMSLLYESDIQSSPNLVWETNFKSNRDFDNQILVVRIYDELGYVEYAAMIIDYNISHLSPYLFSSYKFINN